MEFQIIAGEACLDLINTLDNRPSPEHHKELLSSYRDLADWALQAGVIAARQRAELVHTAAAHPNAARTAWLRAIALRECLYRIVSRRLRDRRPDPDDIAAFNAFLAEALTNLQLQPVRNGFRLDWPPSSESRLDSLLWPVIKSAGDLLTSPDLALVRECDSPSCRWLFVDRSRNHRRRWCDMKVCGNRRKAQRFYRRQHSSRTA